MTTMAQLEPRLRLEIAMNADVVDPLPAAPTDAENERKLMLRIGLAILGVCALVFLASL